ncbi:MAG: protein jag [Clostridia bacterium]|nr:protein jag [Clostridia bacterium]
MRKTIEMNSATVDLAIEEGLLELGTTIEKVEVEILAKGGLFQKAAIKMTTIETPSDIAAEFVNGILKNMNLNATATAEEKSDCIYVEINGPDSGVVIGYRGESLDAIQYLTLTVLNNGEKNKFKKVVVNAENYREKREETLIGLANRLADKACQMSKKIVLEPMNPYERRIIHATLQNSEQAETTSEGEEPNRHVVIIPKGVEILGTIDAKREFVRDNRSSGNRDHRNSGSRDGRTGGGSYARSGSGSSNGSYARRDDHRSGGERRERTNSADRTPRDSYDDYDKIEAKPQVSAPASDFAPLEPIKKVGAPKFKSFGGKKRFPF